MVFRPAHDGTFSGTDFQTFLNHDAAETIPRSICNGIVSNVATLGFIGRVNSETEELSVARMRSPAGVYQRV